MAAANVVTWAGRSILLNKLHGVGTEPVNIGWGIANGLNATYITTSAFSDVNLFQPANPNPEARVAGAVTQLTANQLADVYQVVGTMTCSTAAKTIAEVGLFDTGTSLSGTAQITTSSMAIGATTVTIGAGITGFAVLPTSLNYLAQIENEVVFVTGGQGTSTLTVTRAQLGSTAVAHPIGAFVTAGGDGGAHTANASIAPVVTVNSAGANGGSMFVHGDFANIALNASDSIAFTLKVQLA
jgi:hypothetical protein